MKKSFVSLIQLTFLLSSLLFTNGVDAASRIGMTFLGDWEQTQRYRKGDVISYDNVLYQSLKSKNQNSTPDVNTTHWRKILDGGSGSGANRTPDCNNPGMAANLIACEYPNGSKLKNKDLRGAQLINAKLSGDLGTINLEGANLTGAAFGVSNEGETPVGSSLILQGGNEGEIMANLRGANLSNTVTANGFAVQAAFVELSSANLTGVVWSDANLEGAWMRHSTLLHAQLLNCNCAIVKMSYADLRSAVLWDAKMNGAELYAANLSRAQLSGANLSGADLSYANMTYAALNVSAKPSNLAGANFTGTDLSGVDFTDATGGDTAIYTSTTRFDGAICPDGVKVNNTTLHDCQGHGFGPMVQETAVLPTSFNLHP